MLNVYRHELIETGSAQWSMYFLCLSPTMHHYNYHDVAPICGYIAMADMCILHFMYIGSIIVVIAGTTILVFPVGHQDVCESYKGRLLDSQTFAHLF